MNKKIMLALIIFALTVVVMLFNMKGMNAKIDLNLVITSINSMYKSVAFLGFTLVGIIIGTLLK